MLLPRPPWRGLLLLGAPGRACGAVWDVTATAGTWANEAGAQEHIPSVTFWGGKSGFTKEVASEDVCLCLRVGKRRQTEILNPNRQGYFNESGLDGTCSLLEGRGAQLLGQPALCHVTAGRVGICACALYL